MCAMAAALEKQYLDTPSETAVLEPFEQCVPPRLLQGSLRGELEVYGYNSAAKISVGELGSTDTCEAAIRQLGIRLGVYRWLADVCFRIPEVEILLSGLRLVVSENRHFSPCIQGEPAEGVARDRWGFSLFVFCA